MEGFIYKYLKPLELKNCYFQPHIIQQAEMQKSQQRSQITFKLIMIGDSGVGKSCLLARYMKNQFVQDYCVTIGVEFATKKIPIDDQYSAKLQVWDTAGQQSFRSIVKSFYRNSAAVLLVYDITKKISFQNLKQWLRQSKQYAPKDALFMLMGTHLDIAQKREVSKQMAEQWIQQQGIIMHFQTSSKTSENVTQAFSQITKQLFLKVLDQKKRKSNHQEKALKLQEHPLPQQKMCC